MNEARSIVVIGGGVAGLGPAWQLARRGWTVQLFERKHIGSGASTAAAGMLAPISESTFEEEDLLAIGRHSFQQFPRLVDELTTATGIDLDFRREGTLIVAVDRDDAEALERLYQYHVQLDLPVERLVGDDAREREPGLSPRIKYGIYSPYDHQINPRSMLSALAQDFISSGGEIHENTGVRKLHIGDDGVEGIELDDDTTIDCTHVLIAAGPWSPQIEGIPDGVLPHIRPVRGQMLSVDMGQTPLVEHVIRGPDAYLVPKSDGQLLIGSTMEERGFDSRLTAGGLLDILHGAWEVVPGIYDAPILSTWTGFRPVTLANKPVIGPTSIPGLSLSVGHGRGGILLTPATSYGLATLLDTGEVPDFLAPFQP